jgi:hypothetical protein
MSPIAGKRRYRLSEFAHAWLLFESILHALHGGDLLHCNIYSPPDLEIAAKSELRRNSAGVPAISFGLPTHGCFPQHDAMGQQLTSGAETIAMRSAAFRPSTRSSRVAR